MRNGQTLMLAAPIENLPVTLLTMVQDLLALIFLTMGTIVAVQRSHGKTGRLFFFTALSLALYFTFLRKPDVAFVYGHL